MITRLRCTIQLKGWSDFAFDTQKAPRPCWVCTDFGHPQSAITFPRIVYEWETLKPVNVAWRCEEHAFQRGPTTKLVDPNTPAALSWDQAPSTPLEDIQRLVDEDRKRRER